MVILIDSANLTWKPGPLFFATRSDHVLHRWKIKKSTQLRMTVDVEQRANQLHWIKMVRKAKRSLELPCLRIWVLRGFKNRNKTIHESKDDNQFRYCSLSTGDGCAIPFQRNFCWKYLPSLSGQNFVTSSLGTLIKSLLTKSQKLHKSQVTY